LKIILNKFLIFTKACANNPDVKRLIHFSAAGASPDSDSVDLRTKYIAE
jgi:hypothetical protein